MSLVRNSLALVAATAGLSLSASAAVLYSEAFPNSAGGDRSLGFVGWSLVTALNSSSNITTSTNAHGVVSAGLGSDGVTNGYIYTQPGSAGGTRVFTDTNLDAPVPSPDLAFGNIDTISFDGTSNVTNNVTVQILLQADSSTWYVSNQVFTLNNYNSFATAATNGVLTYTLDFSTATWSTASFAVGAPLSITASSAALDDSFGAITGIGLLVKNNSGSGSTVRLDNLQVLGAAIPEPSAAAALAGFGVLGLAAARRRARR